MRSDVFALYRISYMWYTFFGALVTIVIAHLGILIYGCSDPKTTDATLLAPFLRSRYQRKPRGIIDSVKSIDKPKARKLAPLQSESSL